jgi:hypothetical protein
MTVTAIDLYNILRLKIGESEAKALVEFVELKIDHKFEDNMDQLATKRDLQEVKAELELKIEKVKSEMIKWMFIFWAGQTGLILAVLKLFFQ